MANSGATVSFDIERANTDQDYWNEITTGSGDGSGIDAATQNVGRSTTEAMMAGEIPLGWTNDGPIYRGGSRVIPESFQTETPAQAGYGSVDAAQTYGQNLRRNQRINTSGSPTPTDVQDRTRNDDTQTISAQELSQANSKSGNQTINDDAPREDSERYVPASNQGVWQDFYPTVQGRHNVLHDFNSFNYNLTLVSLSKDQVEDPESYKGKVITPGGVENEDFYIVARSGGFSRTGPNEQFVGPMPAGRQTQFKSGRQNKDLFIENCTFDTRVGINNMGQSNLTTGTFEVTEPHGVGGFYRELFASSKFSGHPNYIDAPFLLIVSFIGREVDKDNAVIPDQSIRYLPVRITNSEMSVNEGGARYTVSFMAYNSVGASDAVSVLWENTEPRGRAEETVESLLYSVFLFNTQKAEEIAIKHQRELNSDAEKTQAVQARLNSNEVGNLAAAQNLDSTQVGAFRPHKYFVWFAESWSGSFPKNAKELSAESASWTSNARQFLDLRNGSGALPGSALPYTNAFGEATMSPEVLPNGVMIMPNLDEQLEEQDAVIDQQEDLISAQKDLINTELATFNQLRETLLTQQESLYGDREDVNQPTLSADITVRAGTRADDATEIISRQEQEATNLANGLLNPAARDPRFPSQAELPPAEVANVVATRTAIEDKARQIRTLTAELGRLEQGLEDLQNTRNTTIGSRQPIGDGNPFGFRKGSSLLDVIDICITNSSQMRVLVGEATLNAIAQTEQIPWYKVDIMSKIIGFDVITMNYQYEYHYVVSPFQVHYSKMPGVNIIFDTETLKRRAVRQYSYIYTGKNLDVLSFDIKYNNLFRYPLLLSPPSENALQSASRETQVTNTRMDESNYEESIQRVENRLNNKLGETGFTMANAIEPMDYLENPTDNGTHIGKALKDFLYAAPTDQGLIRAQVEIVGDPVYIIGSGITDRPSVSFNDVTTPDGEMNSFSREPDVIFEFRFPDDIPTASELASGKSQQQLMEGEYSGLYQVVGVENRFVDGAFTQGLQLLRRRNQRQDFEINDAGESVVSAENPEE